MSVVEVPLNLQEECGAKKKIIARVRALPWMSHAIVRFDHVLVTSCAQPEHYSLSIIELDHCFSSEFQPQVPLTICSLQRLKQLNSL
jgi:hypothetical protein